MNKVLVDFFQKIMGLGNAHLIQNRGVKNWGSTTTLPLGFTLHNAKFDTKIGKTEFFLPYLDTIETTQV